MKVYNPKTNEKEELPKMLMEMPVRDLQNDIIKPSAEGGLDSVIHPMTKKY